MFQGLSVIFSEKLAKLKDETLQAEERVVFSGK